MANSTMNEWIIYVILKYNDKYSGSIEEIMSEFDGTKWKHVYILKTKSDHYSSFLTNRAISDIKWKFEEQGIPCSVQVSYPKLLV